jgi:hypothetical protein
MGRLRLPQKALLAQNLSNSGRIFQSASSESTTPRSKKGSDAKARLFLCGQELLCFFSLEFLTDFTVAGAKALNILAGAARLKSCPDTRQELVVGAADRATIVKDWRRWLTKAGVRDAAFG